MAWLDSFVHVLAIRDHAHMLFVGDLGVCLFSLPAGPLRLRYVEAAVEFPRAERESKAPTGRHFPRPCLPHFASILLTKTEPPQLQGIEGETILLNGRGRICG